MIGRMRKRTFEKIVKQFKRQGIIVLCFKSCLPSIGGFNVVNKACLVQAFFIVTSNAFFWEKIL